MTQGSGRVQVRGNAGEGERGGSVVSPMRSSYQACPRGQHKKLTSTAPCFLLSTKVHLASQCVAAKASFGCVAVSDLGHTSFAIAQDKVSTFYGLLGLAFVPWPLDDAER